MDRDPLGLNKFVMRDFRDREDKSSFFTRARDRGFPHPMESTPGSFQMRGSLGGVTPSSAKRPFDDTLLNLNDSLIKKKRRMSLEDSAGSDSLNSSVGGTPWETKHLRSSLAQARAEIKTLESKVSDISGKLKESILTQDQERIAYKTSLDRERTMIDSLEKRLRVMTRREEKLRADLANAQQNGFHDRDAYESRMIAYRNEAAELQQKLVELESEKKNADFELKNAQSQCARLTADINLANEQVAAMSEQVGQLRSSLREFETVKNSLTEANHRVKELESDLLAQKETEAVVRAQQAKLMKISELERQLQSLTNLNVKLKESSKHSLYLETVVESLKERLALADATEKELMEIRVASGIVSAKLEEYKKAAEDVLGQGASPTQLVHYIRNVQAESLEAANKLSLLECRLNNVEEAKSVADRAALKVNEELESLKRELESCNANLRRMRKQNALITWERNDLRSLVDSMQKEVTLGGLQDPRTEALEKLVEGYRKKLELIENDAQSPGASSSNDSAELWKLKKENELLRQKIAKMELEAEGAKKVDPGQLAALMDENLRLKQKIEQIEGEMEHRALRGDFNLQNTKILHFKMNPTTQQIEQRTDELERLRTEVAQLRERLRLVSEGQVQDLTQNVCNIINEDTTKELQDLRDKVKNQDLANQRLTEAFKSKSREFREAIYALLGYKIDGLKNHTYRLCSLYSESPQHSLLFKMNSSGGMELLETEFSQTLTEMVEQILVQHNSIPMFLASLTMDLFKKCAMSSSTMMESTIIASQS